MAKYHFFKDINGVINQAPSSLYHCKSENKTDMKSQFNICNSKDIRVRLSTSPPLLRLARNLCESFYLAMLIDDMIFFILWELIFEIAQD